MDVSKVKAAILAAKAAVQESVSAHAKAAEKSPIEVNGIPPLVRVNVALDKALEKVDEVTERTTPKVKKAKEDKKK